MSMPLLRLKNLSLKYQSTLLTHPFDLALYASEVLGVVGANGSGKTTLLRSILGDVSDYTGFIQSSEIPYMLPQNALAHGEQTLKSYLYSCMPHFAQLHHDLSLSESQGIPDPLIYAQWVSEFSQRGGYEQEALMIKAITSLGFQAQDLEKNIYAFSGGERRQLALTSAFLNWPLVCLDEPTNHLDMKAIQHLVEAIWDSDATFIIVSHDRDFLNQVSSRILEIERKNVTLSMGNYQDFMDEKARHLLEKQRLTHKLDKEIKHLKAVERGYKTWGGRREKDKKSAFDSGFEGARAARLQKRAIQAQARVRQKIETLENAKPWMEKSYKYTLSLERIPTGQCLEVKGLNGGYGEHVLFKGLNIHLKWGQKLALIGANGTGKSTLLKSLYAASKTTHPQILWSKQLQLGYLPQDVTPPDINVSALFNPKDMAAARHLMGCFKLEASLFDAQCFQLSQGELRKVFLIQLILEKPNLLILDEPTSHLDLPSTELLESILGDYRGSMILVSHDKTFVQNTCDLVLSLDSSIKSTSCV